MTLGTKVTGLLYTFLQDAQKGEGNGGGGGGCGVSLPRGLLRTLSNI